MYKLRVIAIRQVSRSTGSAVVGMWEQVRRMYRCEKRGGDHEMFGSH
jgi:hypothetical protein